MNDNEFCVLSLQVAGHFLGLYRPSPASYAVYSSGSGSL